MKNKHLSMSTFRYVAIISYATPQLDQVLGSGTDTLVSMLSPQISYQVPKSGYIWWHPSQSSSTYLFIPDQICRISPFLSQE